MKPKKENQDSISIECGPDVINGVYANLGMCSVKQEEVTIDFVYIHPQGKTGEVRSRIVMNPRMAKRLVGMMQDQLENYDSEDDDSDDELEIPLDINFN